MKPINPNDILLFSGSLITLIVSLFTAYIPGIAYTTVHSYFVDTQHPLFEPYVHYYPLYFSAHIYTTSFLLSAMGGLLGFLALFTKGKKVYIAVSGIAIGLLGLMYPPTNGNTIIIPEDHMFNVIWIGGFVTTISICLMFLGLIL